MYIEAIKKEIRKAQFTPDVSAWICDWFDENDTIFLDYFYEQVQPYDGVDYDIHIENVDIEYHDDEPLTIITIDCYPNYHVDITDRKDQGPNGSAHVKFVFNEERLEFIED